MTLVLRDYQQEAITSLYNYFEKGGGNPVIAMPTGCHAKGHPILMHDGSIKKVEDVIVGDFLMGVDSRPRRVLALARGRQEMRRVIPNKAEPFVVNLDHKIFARVTRHNHKDFPSSQSRDEVITIRQYEEGSKWYRHLRKLQFASVNFPEALQDVPAYIIGLLLGDGSTINSSVSLTTMDQEIEDAFTSYVKSLGLNLRIAIKSENKAIALFAIDVQANRSTPNRLTQKLRNLSMMDKRGHEKIVPNNYKIANRQQHLELLAGLIDTDAHYSERDHTFQYCTSSPQLAEDVKFIVRSLGLRGQIIPRKTSHRDAYIVCISGDIAQIPTRVARKKARISKKQKDCKVMGFTVEKLPEEDYYGFTLDGDHLYLDSNFVVHHNTGKSLVIAGFCESIFKKWANQKVLIATHVKELIVQNYSELLEAWPFAPAGIYSSGLKRRDTREQIVFVGIQSVAKRWAEFGFVNLLIIDEAHLVGPDEKTSYQLFIKGLKTINPNLRVIGLTATPYRLGYGHIADGELFDDVCFDITGLEAFNRLIAEGYLSPLIPKPTMLELNVEGVKKTGGDYNGKELQVAVDKQEVTYQALKEALSLAHDRRHWLIFASGVEHCEHIAEMMQGFGETCLAIHSKMGSEQRDEAIRKFKRGEVRALVANNILTTGFNSPWVDCIVCLRPTTSSVLWVQMLGRGTRPFLGNEIDPVPKVNCLALDFAGNIRKLGPINDPVVPRKRGEGNGEAPVKLCEVCNTWNHASVRRCILCNAEFPIAVKIKVQAETTDLIKGDLPKVQTFKVDQITYRQHNKVGRPPVLKATYYCGLRSFDEWVCLAHEGFAQSKAATWWKTRTELPVPVVISDALDVIDSIPAATHIRVWLNTPTKYPEILAYCFDGTAFKTQEPDDEEVIISADRGNVEGNKQPVVEEDIPF